MKGKMTKSSSKLIVSPILCVCFGLSVVAIIIYLNTVHIPISRSINNQSNSISALSEALFLPSSVENTSSINTKSTIFHSSIPNPIQNSKDAYVTLISGIDESMKYRGFLYNVLIMKKSLKTLGSTADFIAMIGYASDNIDSDNAIDNNVKQLFQDDLNLLKRHGIITHILPRLITTSLPTENKIGENIDTNTNQGEDVSSSSSQLPPIETLPQPLPRLTFAEMALLKITPWSLTQYDRIQFLDGDVMPTRNMDCFFRLKYNAFTVGAASPLNSGWFLAIPDSKIYDYLKSRAVWRLRCDWDPSIGWKESLADYDLTYRGGHKKCTLWDFNGADMDQGLFTHYFVLNHGSTLLIDTDLKEARFFEKGLKSGKVMKKDGNSAKMVETRHVKDLLINCHSNNPTLFFAHFTGKNKPWITTLKQNNINNSNFKRWMVLLDELKIPNVNSTNLNLLNLGSPLGYYNADMNKKKSTPCVADI